MEREGAPGKVDFVVSSVPAVVARAISDWHFEGYLDEFDQINSWWRTSKAILEQHESVWNLLMEREGLFVRRIDSGLEEVAQRRHRYYKYANFGGNAVMVLPGVTGGASHVVSEWSPELEQAVLLAAKVVGEVRERLRQTRDGSIWHVVDAVAAIQKELHAEALSEERHPWEKTGLAEGRVAILELVEHGEEPPEPPPDGGEWEAHDMIDVVMLVMKRLERIVQVAVDTRERLPGRGEEQGGHV